MFYLSELIGKPVVDRQGNQVARIRDLVAEVAGSSQLVSEDDAEEPVVYVPGEKQTEEPEAPIIKGLLARAGRRNPPFFLPIVQVEGLGVAGARLRSSKVDLKPFERHAGEMLLTRDVWDKHREPARQAAPPNNRHRSHGKRIEPAR